MSVLAASPGDLLATHFSREKHVFCISKIIFKTFSNFPSNFYDYSLSSIFLSQLKLTQTFLKLHFCIISSQIFKEKGMGSYSLTSYLVFWASLSWVFVLMFWFLLWVCFDVFRIVLVWIIKGIVPMQTCFGW